MASKDVSESSTEDSQEQNGSEKPEKKAPLSAAERKRRQRARARERGKQCMELELSHDLKAKLEWAAKKNEMTLKDYVAKFLADGHRNIV